MVSKSRSNKKQLVGNHFKFDDLKVGQAIDFFAKFSPGDVKAFARLSGDYSRIHVEPAFAQEMGFDDQVVHGVLLLGLLSRTVGMLLPGHYGLLLSQESHFRKSVKPGERLEVKSKIISKSLSTKTIDLSFHIFSGKRVLVVSGRAKVKLLI